jgi:BirA family biotin operon repressor/biotin-[acetyl-CoA-carboxylase] ligase
LAPTLPPLLVGIALGVVGVAGGAAESRFDLLALDARFYNSLEMLPPREIWSLETRRIGRKVLAFDRVDSTNSLAAMLAGQPDSDGLALIADEQSSGRGQHGRTWLAAPKSSVLLSVLVYPPPRLCRPAILTAWAAVSVCAVVRQTTGRQPTIKWPNDILLTGRKVCGILIEQSQQGGTPATVAGIGLNVTQTEEQFAQAGLPLATSLAANGWRISDSHCVARLLLKQLDEEYDRLLQGDINSLEASWRAGLGLLGDEVLVECASETRRGRVRELSLSRIVLEQESGTVVLPPESILHLSSV